MAVNNVTIITVGLCADAQNVKVCVLAMHHYTELPTAVTRGRYGAVTVSYGMSQQRALAL